MDVWDGQECEGSEAGDCIDGERKETEEFKFQ